MKRFKLYAAIPIFLYLASTIYFYGNTFIRHISLILLCVSEMALVGIDVYIRKKDGGKMERGDKLLMVAGVIAIIYVGYQIISGMAAS